MSDEQVWVSGRGGAGDSARVHTDPDCWQLAQANSVRGPIPRSEISGNPATCDDCRSAEGGGSVHATLADPDFGPEDLGLDPWPPDSGGESA